MDQLTVMRLLPQISSDWYKIIYDYLLFRLDGKTRTTKIHLKGGGTLFVKTPSPEKGLLCQIFGLNVYDPYGFIKKGDTVIDIGANVGVFSVFAREHGAKVISYEPSSANVARLLEHKAVNGGDQFMVLQKGVWNKEGILKLYLTGLSTSHHFVNEYAVGTTGHYEEVPVVSFETVLKENRLDLVDFVKIDVEGCEFDIVKDLSRDVIRKVKHYSIECENQEVRAKIEKILKNAGYSFKPCISNAYAHIIYAIRND